MCICVFECLTVFVCRRVRICLYICLIVCVSVCVNACVVCLKALIVGVKESLRKTLNEDYEAIKTSLET